MAPTSVSLRIWAKAGIGAMCILGLGMAGAMAPGLALIGVPPAIGVAWWMADRLPRRLWATMLASVAVIFAVLAQSALAVAFIAAEATGVALTKVWFRRPSEDDWFHLVPALYLAALAVALAVDWAAFGGGAAGEFAWFGRLWTEEARDLRGESAATEAGRAPAQWRTGETVLPYRFTGLAAAMGGIWFYVATSIFRRRLAPVRLPKNRFGRFRLKERYAWILVAGLAFRAGWIIRPAPWLGHVAYGLFYFSLGALLTQTVAIAAYFLVHGQRRGMAALGAAGLGASVALAPTLAVPGVALTVGLADVWLDFRRLD